MSKNNAHENNEVAQLLLFCIEDLQRDNEKIRAVKQLKIKYERQRASLVAYKEDCISWSRKKDLTEEQTQS